MCINGIYVCVEMFCPHVHRLQLFICVSRGMCLGLCVHNVCACVWVWVNGSGPVHPRLEASLWRGASTSTGACLSAHPSVQPPLRVSVCVTICMSMGTGVSVSTSICLREKEFLWLALQVNGSVRPCADVRVAAWKKDSVCVGILHVRVYMSGRVCARFCGVHTHLCLHAHTRRYIQVSAQLYVWRVSWILPVCACISKTRCTDQQTCVLLCASVLAPVDVCGSPCLSVYPCGIPACVEICICVSACICSNFRIHLFVILYGCGSAASVHMPASLWMYVRSCTCMWLYMLLSRIWVSLCECRSVCPCISLCGSLGPCL